MLSSNLYTEPLGIGRKCFLQACPFLSPNQVSQHLDLDKYVATSSFEVYSTTSSVMAISNSNQKWIVQE